MDLKKIGLCIFIISVVFLVGCSKNKSPDLEYLSYDILSTNEITTNATNNTTTNLKSTQEQSLDTQKESSKPLSGKVIGIDAGHQLKGNSQQEPIAPGSKQTKNKVTSGTTGRFSKVPEYVVNLQVALLVRDMLEDQGATVVMVRETHDVDISNIERAKLFNKKKTDFAIRIHCNGAEDSSINGVLMMVPTKNPFLSNCISGAELVLKNVCKQTGAKNTGVQKYGDMTGFNWCERMVMIIEMGYMTNKTEDLNLVDSSYQKKMAKGITNGIIEYFSAN